MVDSFNTGRLTLITIHERAGCDDVAAGFFCPLHLSLNYICTEKIKPIEGNE